MNVCVCIHVCLSYCVLIEPLLSRNPPLKKPSPVMGMWGPPLKKPSSRNQRATVPGLLVCVSGSRGAPLGGLRKAVLKPLGGRFGASGGLFGASCCPRASAKARAPF